MQALPSLLGIGASLLIGAASPGPSFVMVAQTAASTGRANGLQAALGMSIGATVFAVASLLGLNTVLLTVPSLYVALKLVGGLYLAYLGFCMWRDVRQPMPIGPTASPDAGAAQGRRNYVLLGLTTQVSNPKTAIVYASVFVAFMPSAPSMAYNLAVAALVFFIEAGWYAVVARALSAHGPRRAYLRGKEWADRVAGGVMVALGLKLAASSTQH